MKIFGFEITKIKDETIPEGTDLASFADNCLTKCNNQLRGIINDKAKEYNLETITYYMGLLIQESIEFGIKIEQERVRNEKLQK